MELGTKLDVVYFDQLREQLNPEKTLMDNVCGGQEFIDIGGQRRHAISYLGDFLFSPERVRTPVKALSGGEQNRAILARLFSKPANLLVLDEPTNDLDIETLELLEEILLDFDGTVLLVSHDRDFMDKVVTSLLIVKGDGNIESSVGGYSDWIARGGQLPSLQAGGSPRIQVAPGAPTAGAKAGSGRGHAAGGKKKQSHKDQRELDALPVKIEQLETRQGELEQRIAEPGFYQGDHKETEAVLSELTEVQANLERAYGRWEELENA